MKTISETRFEEYCIHRGYSFTRIELPPTAGRRADYRLHSSADDLVCEVKQLENTEWENERDEQLRTVGQADLSRSIGTRARAMIKDAAPQLKNHRHEKVPLVVVGLDLTWHTHLSEYDVDAGMFGQPLVRFHLNGKDPRDDRSDFGHGGGRQMTEDSRCYISGVCVLDRRELKMKIYHNPFAETLLWPRYFPHPDDLHYIKDGHPERAGHLWLEYIGERT
jgi:hypothetical protein